MKLLKPFIQQMAKLTQLNFTINRTTKLLGAVFYYYTYNVLNYDG